MTQAFGDGEENMTDVATEFFDKLEARGHEPVLEKSTGTVRFDIKDGKRTARWLIRIEKGDLAVSRRNAKADCVVRMDKALFDSMATGRANPTAALLRGDMAVEGDVGLLTSLQRLFPGPPRKDS
jgi:putative sterol carrier protein